MKKFFRENQTTIISLFCILGILTAETAAVIGAFSCVLVYVLFKKILGF